MKIMYIHGWLSCFDINSEKIKEMIKVGHDVVGFNIDFTLPFEKVKEKLKDFAELESVDFIVGTSLGGYWSAIVGKELNIPFCSINPAIDPKEKMKVFIGDGVDFDGNSYFLNKDVPDSYKDFPESGDGLILLDLGDEIIDAKETWEKLHNNYKVFSFEGGSHSFENMETGILLMETYKRKYKRI